MVAQPADFTVCGSSGIRQGPASDRKDGVPRYSKKFTNEPGMSMKTNEEVKTSVMLSEAKDLQSYVFKEILQMLRSAQQDGAACSWQVQGDATASQKSYERTGNVYENKQQGQNVCHPERSEGSAVVCFQRDTADASLCSA